MNDQLERKLVCGQKEDHFADERGIAGTIFGCLRVNAFCLIICLSLSQSSDILFLFVLLVIYVHCLDHLISA